MLLNSRQLLSFTLVASTLTGCSFSKPQDEKPQTIVVQPGDLRKVDQIFNAIDSSNPEALNSALVGASYEQVNSVNSSNETPLERAVRTGRVTAVEALIKAGAISLHYASDRTLDDRRTVLDLALEIELRGANRNISYILKKQVEQQTADFNSALTKTDYAKAWEVSKRANLSAVNLDEKVIDALVEKTRKLKALSTADEILLEEIIEANNLKNEWTTGKVGSLFAISLVTREMKYLDAVTPREKSLEVDLTKYLDDNAIQSVDYVGLLGKLLSEKNIKYSLDALSPVFVNRLKAIVSSKDYASWNQFNWLIQNIKPGAEPLNDPSLRDSFVDYVVNYYYSYERNLGSSFPIDDVYMILDAGKKLNGDLSVSYSSLSLLSGRYLNHKSAVFSKIASVANYTTPDFWKSAFENKSYEEIKPILKEFNLSSLTLEQGCKILELVSVRNNMATYETLLSEFPLEKFFTNKNEFLNLLEKYNGFTKEDKENAELIFFRLVEMGKKLKLNLSDKDLSPIRLSEVKLMLKDEGRFPKFYCALNNLSTYLPKKIITSFEGKELQLNLPDLKKLAMFKNLKDAIENCTSTEVTDSLAFYDGTEISANSIFTLIYFNYDPMNSNANTAFAKTLDIELNRNSLSLDSDHRFDAKVVNYILNEFIKLNNFSIFKETLKHLKLFLDPNYTGEVKSSILSNLEAFISHYIKGNKAQIDSATIINILSILKSQNIRFAIGLREEFSSEYSKFLQNCIENQDPLITFLSSSNHTKEKIVNELSIKDVKLVLDRIRGYEIPMAKVEQKNEIYAVTQFKKRIRTEIDEKTFSIFSNINKELSTNENWNKFIDTLPTPIKEVIEPKERTSILFPEQKQKPERWETGR